jgi:hypothetical protein
LDGQDLLGRFLANTADELLSRLRSARDGKYGCLVLWHGDGFPALSVHFNEDVAYIHYFVRDRHAGFQASGMTPRGCPEIVHFHGLDGASDAFDMTSAACLEPDAAIGAAIEFLRSSARPPSITWVEL